MIALTIQAHDEDEAAEIIAAVKAVRGGRRTRRRREVTALSLPLDTAAGAR